MATKTIDGVVYEVMEHKHDWCSCSDTHGVACPLSLPGKRHLCFRKNDPASTLPEYKDDEGNTRYCPSTLLVDPENKIGVAAIARWRFEGSKHKDFL